MCQSVISRSLTLRDTNIRGFRVKFYFSKIRMEPVMLSFLATTENIKIRNQNDRINNCGKVVKHIQWEIAIRNFHRRKLE